MDNVTLIFLLHFCTFYDTFSSQDLKVLLNIVNRDFFRVKTTALLPTAITCSTIMQVSR